MNSNQDSTNAKMESHHPSATSGEEPTAKKRKSPTAVENENELEKLKAEMAKMKQLLKEQQKTICSQAMTITRLQDTNNTCDTSDDDITGTVINDDGPLQLSNVESLQLMNDEKNKLEKEFGELKSTMEKQVLGLQLQNVEKEDKIKQLESILSAIKNIKADPDYNETERNCFPSCCDCKDKIKDLEAQLASKVSTENALRTTLAQVEDDRNQLTKLLHQTDDDNLKSMVVERNKKIEEMEKMLEMKEEDLKDLESRFTELDSIYKDIEQQKMNAADAKYNQLVVEHEKTLQSMSAEMKMKVENKRQKRNAELNKLMDSVADLNQKVCDKDAIITKCSNLIKKMNTAKLEVENERNECLSEIDKLKVTVVMLNQNLSINQTLIIRYENEINEMKAAMQSNIENDTEKHKAECEKLKNTVADLNKKLTSKLNAADLKFIENEKLRKRITVLEIAESKLRSKIEELEQNEHEANETIAEQERKIQHFESGLTKCENGLKYITLDEICKDLTIPLISCLISSVNNIILKVSRISSRNGNLEVFSINNKQLIDFKLLDFFTNTSFQFQVDGELEINSVLFYMIIPRIYSCNLTMLNLDGALISYEIFIKLVSSNTIKSFKDVKVQNKKDKRLGYAEILKELSNIEIFEMEESDYCMISELCKNLSQLPPLSNLRQFNLSPIDPLFDLVTFGDFVKKNPNAEFHLQYPPLSKPQETLMKRKERIMRQNLPSNCKVFISF